METFEYVLAWLEVHPALTQVVGILLGATIAMLAARRAYRGVVEQINAAVEMAESSRKHEMVMAERSRRHEQVLIYTAFASDLDALQKSLAGLLAALNGDEGTEQLGIVKSVFLENRNVIWESRAPKIGAIDKNHAANIIETYRFIEALTGRVRELNLENQDHRNDLAVFIKALIKQINVVLSGLPLKPDREKAQQ